MFYDIEDTGDAAAVELAYEVESCLAAMTAGVCSEAAFQLAMKSLSSSLSIVVPKTEPIDSQNIVFPDLSPLKASAAAAAAGGTVVFAYVGTAPSVGFWSTTEFPSTHQTSTDPLQWQQVPQAL